MKIRSGDIPETDDELYTVLKRMEKKEMAKTQKTLKSLTATDTEAARWSPQETHADLELIQETATGNVEQVLDENAAREEKDAALDAHVKEAKAALRQSRGKTISPQVAAEIAQAKGLDADGKSTKAPKAPMGKAAKPAPAKPVKPIVKKLEPVFQSDKFNGVNLYGYTTAEVIEKIRQFTALYGAAPEVILVEGQADNGYGKVLSLSKHMYHAKLLDNNSAHCWQVLEIDQTVAPVNDVWARVKIFTVRPSPSYKGEKITPEKM